MLLTSPGDNNSSLSMDSLHKQPDVAEDQRTLEGDHIQLAHTRMTASDGIRADSSLFEGRSGVANNGGTSTAAPLLPLPVSRSFKTPTHEIELDGLYALRQAAGLNALRSVRTSLLGSGTLAKLAASKAAGYLDNSFAAPLSPLRVRDIQALSELFLRDDIYVIEADVSHRLLALLPEPYWEDDTFAFLQEFL